MSPPFPFGPVGGSWRSLFWVVVKNPLALEVVDSANHSSSYTDAV